MKLTGLSKKTQLYITLTCYVFLSFGVFCPVFSSKNLLLSLFFCILSAVVWTLFASMIFKKSPFCSNKSGLFHKSISIFSALFSVISVLLLMTEVIKDTCYIVGKGVSREYYFALSLALLTVSLYLCFNSEKGIYRFSFIGIFAVILFITVCVLPFFTVKQTVFDFHTEAGKHIADSVIGGCICGLFLSGDISAFFCCFEDFLNFEKGVAKLSFFAVLTAFLLWCIPIFGVYLVFGKNLTAMLSDPLYAITKTHRGFDITEALSALRIFTFIIKSSVYIYSASICVKKAFFAKKTHALKVIIPVLFSSVPAVYLPFLFIGSNNYGKFQNFIYPSVIMLSLIFVFVIIFRKKEN